MHPGMEMPEALAKGGSREGQDTDARPLDRPLVLLGVLSAGAGWSAHAMGAVQEAEQRQVDEIR